MFRLTTKFALLTAALSGALTGCGGAPDDDVFVLRVGNGAEVQDLDPHVVTGVPEHRVMNALFEGLVDLEMATLEPRPAVAESWTVSADGRVYTFKLRDNAKWSNGDPVTSEDFVYSWRRMLSPALAAEYAGLLHCVNNAKAFNEGTLPDPAELGVEAPDPLTLVVTLEHPTPYFLKMHTHQAWMPVHRATIEKFGATDERHTPWTRSENHVGNGPYQLDEWAPGEYIDAGKNLHYWDADAVQIERIRWFPIDNQLTEERKFRAGELHWTEDIPLHKVEGYRQDRPEVLVMHPYLGVYYYRVNVTEPPLDDVRVRRALALALDRETICRDVTKGGEEPAYHYVPPNAGDYTTQARVPYNVAKARELLAEAGYPNGEGLRPLEILYNTRDSHKTIAEAIQRIWKRDLGVDVQLVNQDWKVYLASMDNLDYDLARSGWIGDVVDPVNFLECFLTDNGNNRTGFSNAAYDALINKAYAATDAEARYGYLQEAEAILLDEAPILPIYFYTRKFLKRPEVKGYGPNVLGYIAWRDLYIEGELK